MNIEYVQHPDGSWTATDADRYDGAPDGDRTFGSGKNRFAALMDLCDNYGDQETSEIWHYLAAAYELGMKDHKHITDKVFSRALGALEVVNG